MTDLDYAKVIGRFGLTVGDTGTDPDDDPDTVWCTEGRVIITPLNTFVKVAGGSPVPWTGGNAQIECAIDANGYLTYTAPGGTTKQFVEVVDLTSSKVNPQITTGATHRVTFADVKSGTTPVAFPTFTCRLTAAGDGVSGAGINDLTIVAPIVPGEALPITRGPQGVSIESLAVNGLGELEVQLDDGTTVNAGDLPVGPGGSDAGVAGYLGTPASASRAALDDATADLLDDPTSAVAIKTSASFAQHTEILDPWFAALRANPATAKIALGPGDSTTDSAAAGVSLHNRLKNAHMAPLEGLGGMSPANILNFGFNGITIDAWLADSTAKLAAMVAADPDLIVYSLGINTIRNASVTAAQLTAKHRQVIDLLRGAMPGVPIIARIPNTFLTTDVGSAGYVSPNSDAQAKSTALRASYLALIGTYPDVLVYDAPERVFGTTSLATSAYMGDQIHPSQTGFYALADDLVKNFIGRKPPFNPGLAAIARAASQYAPWTVYGREVEDTDRYVLVASGEFAAQGATFIDFGYPGPQGGGSVTGGGNITYYDLVEMPDGTTTRIPVSGWQVINQNASTTRILTPSGAIPTYTGTGGTVKVWRQRVGGDTGVEAVMRDSSWRYRRTGRIIGGSTSYMDIAAFSTTADRATEPASAWAVAAGDKVYVEGKGSTAQTITGGSFAANGNNLRIFSGLDGTDWSAYVGRLVTVVGTHA